MRSRVRFEVVVAEWERTVLPIVQEIDTEESPAHHEAASRSSLRRDGDGGDRRSGSAVVHRVFGGRRIRTGTNGERRAVLRKNSIRTKVQRKPPAPPRLGERVDARTSRN